MLINYRGKIDEVTVVFEPLGLNQFLKCDLAEVAVGRASRTFNPYGAEFDQFLVRLFARKNVDQRRQLLEDFFLTHYQPFQHDVLSRSLECLTDIDKNIPVSQIARSVGVCHKTLTRIFQRHLGSTPVVLRKIARFRRSLALRFGGAASSHLTQLAHLSNYYDQPQFIKQYRQLTGESPAKFFRHVSAVDGRDVFWRML
jgi:AraC-like DNA-binding protein